MSEKDKPNEIPSTSRGSERRFVKEIETGTGVRSRPRSRRTSQEMPTAKIVEIIAENPVENVKDQDHPKEAPLESIRKTCPINLDARETKASRKRRRTSQESKAEEKVNENTESNDKSEPSRSSQEYKGQSSPKNADVNESRILRKRARESQDSRAGKRSDTSREPSEKGGPSGTFQEAKERRSTRSQCEEGCTRTSRRKIREYQDVNKRSSRDISLAKDYSGRKRSNRRRGGEYSSSDKK